MDAVDRVSAGEPQFLNETQFSFYMLYQTVPVKSFPEGIGLGYLLGHAAGKEGAPNLVTPSVDTNWKDPHGKNGYAFFIDQPSTLLPYTHHAKAWSTYEDQLFHDIVNTISLLAKTQNIELNQTILYADAKDIVRFDHLLALNYRFGNVLFMCADPGNRWSDSDKDGALEHSRIVFLCEITDETTRRQYERSYNPMTIDELTKSYPKINWYTFVREATSSAQNVSTRILNDTTYQYIVMEPKKLKSLNDMLGDPSFVSSRTVVNYIYYNVVSKNSDFLPWETSSTYNINRIHLEHPFLGRPRRRPQEKRKYERRQQNSIDEAQRSCAMEAVFKIPYANARVFIDKIYPTNKSRTFLRSHVAKIASSILIGFRSMLDQLNWMTPATKKAAYSKIDNLVKNVAYPDWITDDTKLTAYYQDIGIKVEHDDYFTIVAKIQAFNDNMSWRSLITGPTNRQDFNGPPGTTNAWYQPELNSITFPAAILHKPFYDPTWPSAVNFGGLGVIAGHELTHGFDDQGVQWDGTGVLSGWMDDISKSAFGKMAKCVVNEYNGFCPLNRTAYGTAACIDGAQTQGENIADNGGIHAAYRAYRNFINLYGPDPQLPDDELQEFTSDQLFFLSFARVWCKKSSSDKETELQILIDPHSPAQYRVWGTIQNFPAFKDAFHCPSSPYAPDEHCNVWVSDIDSCE
ncbi:peptidase family M13 [Dictyocaulus viviparus]|uniref:Peptidase family M13 n=1 Tax=Dictyocaulus viviparus TaxID=29172 RepID=A0A0D8Y7N9_DICVI|nr:peptidase family M13 [Dictyocaulus viviparus]